jgi:hypothetical protein
MNKQEIITLAESKGFKLDYDKWIDTDDQISINPFRLDVGSITDRDNQGKVAGHGKCRKYLP